MSETTTALAKINEMKRQAEELGIDYDEEMAISFEGVNVSSLPTIKVEHSKMGKHKLYFDFGKTYDDDGGDQEVIINIPNNELSGIIPIAVPVRAFFEEDKQIPTCSAVNGVPNRDDALATSCNICKESNFDTGRCKSKIKALFIMNKEPNACILLLPPTSIKHFNSHMKKLKKAGRLPIMTNTKIYLEDIKKGSYRYAEINMTMDGMANPELIKIAKVIRDECGDRLLAVNANDYSDTGDTVKSDYSNEGEVDGDDVPF